MVSPHNLENVEVVITSHWNKLKNGTTSELRESMLVRCVKKADEKTIENFKTYANKILPF